MILHTGHPPWVSDSPWTWVEVYHVTPLTHRPWVVLRDGAGFSDPLTMDYLTFYAWQDRTPKQVRSEGRWLAIAATWLAGDQHHDWTHADWDLWQTFVQDVALHARLCGQAPTWQARQAVATLHRAYAYWHWKQPQRFPFQPFPGHQADRQAWIDQALGDIAQELWEI